MRPTRLFALPLVVAAVLMTAASTGCEDPIPPGMVAQSAGIAFGEVVTNKTATESIAIRNVTAVDIEILSAEVLVGDDLTIPVDPTGEMVAAGADYTLDLTWIPTTEGNFNGSLRITYAGPVGVMIIPISGMAIPPSLTVPGEVQDFGNVIIGQTSVPIAMNLRNDDTESFQILSFDFADGSNFAVDGAAPTGTIDPGNTVVVNVVFTPTAGGDLTDTLMVTYDSPGVGSAQEISLTGEGIPDPFFDFDTTALDWGDVALNAAPIALQVTVTNSGTRDGDLTSITLGAGTDSGFSITNVLTVPATVGMPGSTNPLQQVIEITLDPQAASTPGGMKSGTVEIAHDGLLQTSPIVITLDANILDSPTVDEVRVCRYTSAGAEMHVEFDVTNPSPNGVNVNSSTLLFSDPATGNSVSSDYTVTPDAGNPTTVGAGQTETFRMTVTVAGSPAFTSEVDVEGEIDYDASLTSFSNDSGSWKFITTAGAPSIGDVPNGGRWGGQAWSDGNTLYYIGGADLNNGILDIISHSGGSWTTVASLPNQVFWSSAMTISGEFYTMGSATISGGGLGGHTSVINFNGTAVSTESFSASQSMLSHGTTDGTKGYGFNGTTSALGFASSTMSIDPTNNSSNVGSTNTNGLVGAGLYHCPGYDSTAGQIVWVLGSDFLVGSPSGQWDGADAGLVYNPTTDQIVSTFRPTDFGLVARTVAGNTVHNNVLFIVGGNDPFRLESRTVQVFDLQTRVGGVLGVQTSGTITDSGVIVHSNTLYSIAGRPDASGLTPVSGAVDGFVIPQ